ncbi:MAG TPA: hypothetical protein VG186_12430 [Solirubrobacteraceae bacterium]|jgi:hypothetical protein|nr:hypothetical protein [Solirubrobacteraceae bacterium]
MIKERIQKFLLGLGEKLMALAETKIKAQLPQLMAMGEAVVKEKIPELKAQAEETVKEKGTEVATKVRTQVQDQIKSQLSGEKLIPRAETFAGGVAAGDGLVTTPFLVGFLASGGVGGALGIPFKLVRVVVLRPIFGSRTEARVKIDRNSKDLGRALAALAAADKRLRRRRGIIGLFLPSFRKVVLIGGAGAAYVAMSSNGNRAELIESIAPRLDKVRETVESTELYAMIAPDLEKAVEALGERVDAIR